ncbi:hypothetical protein HOO68_06035 [Candidatus Gracilibacteria bacterium]|nr:hypothetical protein [Candidatus Gracilibacteria bacterium]
MTDAQIHERCVQVYVDRVCSVDGRDDVVPVLEELYKEAVGKGKMIASADAVVALQNQRQVMIEIVKNEEELDGEMPETVWTMITSHRNGATEILRAVVRTVKKSVLEKFATIRTGGRMPMAENMLTEDDKQFLKALTQSLMVALLLVANRTSLGVKTDNFVTDAEHIMDEVFKEADLRRTQ